ncbi:IS66 family transposase zinc-finger binding domain-containing protein, partial [Thorsellia kenyensis]
MKNQSKPFNIEEIKQLDKEQLIALVVDLFKRYNFAEEKLKAMMMRTFARKSEVNDKQFNLFTEEEFSELASFIESTHSCDSTEATLGTSEDAPAKAESSTPPKRSRGRKVINPDLPREDRIIDLEDKTCKTCSSEMTPMGEAISEKVDFIPAKIVVIRTKRIKYTCTCCQTLVAAPM